MLFLDNAVAALAGPVLWWVFLNGLDELFFDSCYLYLKLSGRAGVPVFTENQTAIPEQRVAVFVPLWREDAVIEEMINHNIAAVEYSNYDIFLGVYRNDSKTIEKARALAARYSQVHAALCPHDGPTNKADCLNWIYRRMLAQEETRQARYEIIVQHDAEDIIHAKAFRLINALAGSFDMIQIPVLPLATGKREFTHGTYCDEFAEYQTKDIVTRQLLGGFVPSAGVGTAYRRDALEDVAGGMSGRIFNTQNLAEDYEIGLRFKLSGKRQVLACRLAPLRNGNGGNGKGRGNGHTKRNGNTRTNGAGHGNGNGNGIFWSFKRWARNRYTNGTKVSETYGSNGKTANGKINGGAGYGNGNGGFEHIATREYFPRRFRHAVRQKSRWVMGVSLQTWEQWGWPGAWSQLYWLWRDRKGLIGSPIALLSNLIFFYCLAMWLAAWAFNTGWKLTGIFPSREWPWLLLCANTFFLIERLAFKMHAVRKIYGSAQALPALLRTPWANLINFCSTAAAIFTYAAARLRRRQLQWAKTAHAFPDRASLMEFKRPLGEILVQSQRVSPAALEAALSEQAGADREERLGEALVRLGHVNEWDVVEALGRQHSVEVWRVEASSVAPAAVRAVPRGLAVHYQVVPAELQPGGVLIVAGPEILAEMAIEELRAVTGLEVHAALTSRSAWEKAIVELYSTAPSTLQGAVVALGYVGHEQMESVLREQSLVEHELPEVLLGKGWVTEQQLSAAFRALGKDFRRITARDITPGCGVAVPAYLQRELGALPLAFREDYLIVAVARALTEAEQRRLEAVARSPVHLVYTLPGDLRLLLDDQSSGQ